MTIFDVEFSQLKCFKSRLLEKILLPHADLDESRLSIRWWKAVGKLIWSSAIGCMVNSTSSHWIFNFDQPRHIRWPQDAYMHEVVNSFEQKKGIPGVIGAIDCTHIAINAPKEHKENYFDRKKTYSIVLQAVVDANKSSLT
ncbi:PREDICTED: uncharacterized protein LOC108371272 [Rhagoletis zephyria]|uniref:uncharacterized protein LOC108371272 n=1 Tax=Rhagoletis zephyria TaxID=28612 RepID=UPI00081150E4|nr:PREDICTED: uncharacterized protein LOC108371272 [Rhagoletis zephyria]